MFGRDSAKGNQPKLVTLDAVELWIRGDSWDELLAAQSSECVHRSIPLGWQPASTRAPGLKINTIGNTRAIQIRLHPKAFSPGYCRSTPMDSRQISVTNAHSRTARYERTGASRSTHRNGDVNLGGKLRCSAFSNESDTHLRNYMCQRVGHPGMGQRRFSESF
jgi:hypothetical protein